MFASEPITNLRQQLEQLNQLEDDNAGCEGNTVRLCLPATVENFHLAYLLNSLLEKHQHRVCLDVSRVSRLGTVEFRVLGSFPDQFKRRGGFLKLEHATASMTALVREFGSTELLADIHPQPSA